MYWSVNAGGRLTERQWDRWDERKALEKLKLHTSFQFETLKGRNTLGDLRLYEM
jgi:hypothetical protein